MKRRLAVLLALCFACGVTSAQQSLEHQVASLQRSVDSVNVLIAQARNRYADEPESREQIAGQLVNLELEAISLKRELDKALQLFTAREQQQFLQSDRGVGSSVASSGAEDNSAATVHYPKRANLVDNRVLTESLTASDLKLLRASQQSESAVVAKIKEYMRLYDKMATLQLEYERVETQASADSVIQILDSVRNVAQNTERVLSNRWHDVFDNKVYIYNLLLEKSGKMNVISGAEQLLSAAMISSDQRSAECESKALVEYYYRKKALLDYESKVAAAYDLNAAKDSLARVSTAMKEGGYILPKITIVRRAFIDHEPIKVVKPTIYTPKNPIPHTKIYDYGTVYRVRIGIFTKRPNLSALKGITPLSYTDKYHDGKYTYFVGGYRSEEEALQGVAYLKKLGFRDPQLVMWVDGEYISNIAEWKSKNLGYNLEITGVTTLPDDVKAHIGIRNDQARFSRVGVAFIVGTFASKADAELVASEVAAMNSALKVEVKSVK